MPRSHAAGEPGIIKGADQFEFVYRVKLPEINGEARIWIPLAKTDAFQTVNVEELNIPMKWEKVQDRDYGNDICVLYAQPRTAAKQSSCDTGRAQGKSRLSCKQCGDRALLRPEKLVPINETFKTLAQKAVAGKTDDLERAKALVRSRHQPDAI